MAEKFDIGDLGRHFSRLTTEEKAIRLAAFYSILNGKAASADELALQSGVSAGQAQRCIKDLVDQGMIVIDKRAAVVGSHGLSLIPTDHRLSINGQNLFTWCAADAVGIPAGLGVDAKVISKCFQCNAPVEIDIAGGEIIYSSQQDARIWVIEADLNRSIAGCA